MAVVWVAHQVLIHCSVEIAFCSIAYPQCHPTWPCTTAQIDAIAMTVRSHDSDDPTWTAIYNEFAPHADAYVVHQLDSLDLDSVARHEASYMSCLLYTSPSPRD